MTTWDDKYQFHLRDQLHSSTTTTMLPDDSFSIQPSPSTMNNDSIISFIQTNNNR